MAHGDAREGKWGGNWRMEWVPVLFTLPRNTVYPALLPLMRTPRLPVVDWTDAPADLNGFVRFAERRNKVSALMPSHFNWPLPHSVQWTGYRLTQRGTVQISGSRKRRFFKVSKSALRLSQPPSQWVPWGHMGCGEELVHHSPASRLKCV